MEFATNTIVSITRLLDVG